MKEGNVPERGKGALELIEEAVHLLRRSSARSLASYYIGSLPFVLALLYFWADMSRSPFAEQHLAGAGLGLAALFVWMKVWQAVFAGELLDALAGSFRSRGWRHWARVLVTQATVQPSGLFVLPLASVPVLPFAWADAFYQNVTVFGAEDSGSTRALCRRAARQARAWPKQNHAALCVLMGFGLFVYLNWATVILLLPLVLKTLLGIQTAASRGPETMLNTTFLAVTAGLTYLSVDPLVKALYALRCFYGEARESGADLKAELREFSRTPVLIALLLLLLPVCAQAQAQAQEPTRSAAETRPVAQQNGLAPKELDRALSEVLREPKYTWRSPRPKLAPADRDQRGILGRFLESVGEAIQGWAKSFGNWLERVLRKFFGSPQPLPQSSSGFAWMTRLHVLMYVLAAAALIGLGWLIRTVLRNRRPRTATLAAEPVQPAVDLAEDDIAADQLPEDGWTRLALQFLQRGEFRLAIRADYLASLAHLAEKNLVTIARFKSNRDYERELGRRAHAWPDLVARFSENVRTFDRVWYGMHAVDDQLVSVFAANVDGMRTGASEP